MRLLRRLLVILAFPLLLNALLTLLLLLRLLTTQLLVLALTSLPFLLHFVVLNRALRYLNRGSRVAYLLAHSELLEAAFQAGSVSLSRDTTAIRRLLALMPLEFMSLFVPASGALVLSIRLDAELAAEALLVV